MCIDEEDQKLYVYGGRYLSQFNSADSDSSDSDTNNYSGMYVYHIADNLWQPLLLHLHSDIRTKFHCRVGHSMVFDSVSFFFCEVFCRFFFKLVNFFLKIERKAIVDIFRTKGKKVLC